MIERARHTRGCWDISCDRCSHVEQDLEAEDFRHVVSQIRTLGWDVRQHPQVRSEWEHICPDCHAKENTAKVDHGGY